MKKNQLNIFIDGSSKGNPGPSGIGVVITDQDGVNLREISKYIGPATNNVAEYTALIYGLQDALKLNSRIIMIHTDSELLANQLSGKYKVKNENIKALYSQVQHLLEGFDEVQLKAIDRSNNKDADKLAYGAVQKHLKKSNKKVSAKSNDTIVLKKI